MAVVAVAGVAAGVKCRRGRLSASLLHHCSSLVFSIYYSASTNMVVKNRICYIRRMLEIGAKLTAVVSNNDNTGVDKFKVILDPSIHFDPYRQCFAQQLLDILDHACRTHHIADKGHKHSEKSGGKSEALFFLTPVSTPSSSTKRQTVPLNREAPKFIPAPHETIQDDIDDAMAASGEAHPAVAVGSATECYHR